MRQLTEKERETAVTLSDYAQTDPLEFVAEVHAELMAGHGVFDEIMKIYRKYHGPVPKN